jgi:hypothetical protein
MFVRKYLSALKTSSAVNKDHLTMSSTSVSIDDQAHDTEIESDKIYRFYAVTTDGKREEYTDVMAMKELIDEGVIVGMQPESANLPTRQRNPQSWWLMDDSGSNVDTQRLAMFRLLIPTDAVHPNGWKASVESSGAPQTSSLFQHKQGMYRWIFRVRRLTGKGVKAARIRLVVFSIPSDTDLKKLVQHIDKDGIQQLPRQSEFSDNV